MEHQGDEDTSGNALNWRIPEWFPELNGSVQEKLKLLHSELLKFNKAINLISAGTVATADAVHFADSIIAGRAILESSNVERIHDIGSGNGFPGLVMAVMAPNRTFILVERDKRKVEYLRHIKAALDLSNVEVAMSSAEQLGEGSVECGVSRGFTSMAKALLLMRRYFKTGGEYFHLKGDTWTRELGEIPTQLCGFWQPELLCQYDLPHHRGKMAILRARKL